MKNKFSSIFTMKNHSIIKLAALLYICCSMVGCLKIDVDNLDDIVNSTKGSIYGTVTDFVTGDPVSNVNVRLNPNGETTLTGSDGIYQFDNVEFGQYWLSLSKYGYEDLDDDYVIVIQENQSARRDVQIKSSVSSFQVLMNGQQEDVLDFGKDPSLNVLNFLIVNQGATEMLINIEGSNNWISLPYNMHQIHIKPNEGFTAKVEIKRSLLNVGENVGNLVISSGTQTQSLTVKAEGIGMPMVTDLVLSDIHTWYLNAQASVADNGGWQIVDKGFEYVDDDDYEYNWSCGSGIDGFQAQIICDFTIIRVRAYATNGVHKAYSDWVLTGNH